MTYIADNSQIATFGWRGWLLLLAIAVVAWLLTELLTAPKLDADTSRLDRLDGVRAASEDSVTLHRSGGTSPPCTNDDAAPPLPGRGTVIPLDRGATSSRH